MLIGDLNFDGIINVIDIVTMVNGILGGGFTDDDDDDNFGGGKGVRVGQMEPVPVTVPAGA